jgi:type I restriction enzyme S subunit
MNNVNFLEKLLDGVEVEWKALGEVAQIPESVNPYFHRSIFI